MYVPPLRYLPARGTPPLSIGSGLSWSDPRTRASPGNPGDRGCRGDRRGNRFQTVTNLRARGIASGFDFLGRTAGLRSLRAHRVLVARHLRARPLSASSTRFAFRCLASGSPRCWEWRWCGASLERLGRLHDRERLPRGDTEHAASPAVALLVLAGAGAAWPARCAEAFAGCVSLFPRIVFSRPEQAGCTWIAMDRPVSPGSGFKVVLRSHRSSRHCSLA